MVDERRLKKKLPGLLIDSPTTNPESWNDYQRKLRSINHLEQREPLRFRRMLNDVASALDRMDEALYQSAEEVFGKRVKK